MREHRNKSPPKSLIDAIQFAFSVIITGSTFSETESLFLWNNIIPPSESTFYRVQKKITEAIVEMAKESCLKWKLTAKHLHFFRWKFVPSKKYFTLFSGFY